MLCLQRGSNTFSNSVLPENIVYCITYYEASAPDSLKLVFVQFAVCHSVSQVHLSRLLTYFDRCLVPGKPCSDLVRDSREESGDCVDTGQSRYGKYLLEWKVCVFLQITAATTALWGSEPVNYPCCNDSILNRTVHFCFQVTHKMQIMSEVGIAIDKVLHDQYITHKTMEHTCNIPYWHL